MEKTEKILNKTVPFLKEAGKYSISATAKVVGTLFLFSVVNVFLLVFGFYYFFKEDYSANRLYLLLLMIVIAVASTIFACMKMYNFVIVDAARVYFGKIDDFKLKIAGKIVDKLENGMNNNDINKTPVNKIINVADVVTDLYGKVPKSIVKIFNFIVGKIPLMDFSTEIKDHIASGNKEAATQHFVTKTNEFFKENIFDQNNTRIVYWTLLINVILHILVLYFLKK